MEEFPGTREERLGWPGIRFAGSEPLASDETDGKLSRCLMVLLVSHIVLYLMMFASVCLREKLEHFSKSSASRLIALHYHQRLARRKPETMVNQQQKLVN